MGRQVVTQKDLLSFAAPQPAAGVAVGGVAGGVAAAPQRREQPKLDTYQERLLKYIPTEVVTTYVFLDGVLRSASATFPVAALRWFVFVVLLFGTWFYLNRVEKVTRRQQLVISTVAFGLWVFSLGGPFAAFHWYSPVYGAVLLPLYTFGVAIERK